jgi:hypothetical protein
VTERAQEAIPPELAAVIVGLVTVQVVIIFIVGLGCVRLLVFLKEALI